MSKFDINKIQELCSYPYGKFSEYAEYNDESDYYFKDNDSHVLAIAHLDYVLKASHFDYVISSDDQELVYSPVLDDRLGAYIILEYLPKLGLKYDILLTNNEEIHQSTAAHFQPKKQYNWVFQFDRKGTDVVLYKYHNEYMVKILNELEFEVGRGTSSDISYLNIGCKGINFGVCYYYPHKSYCYANLTELEQQITKFQKFYNKYHNYYFEH